MKIVEVGKIVKKYKSLFSQSGGIGPNLLILSESMDKQLEDYDIEVLSALGPKVVIHIQPDETIVYRYSISPSEPLEEVRIGDIGYIFANVLI